MHNLIHEKEGKTIERARDKIKQKQMRYLLLGPGCNTDQKIYALCNVFDVRQDLGLGNINDLQKMTRDKCSETISRLINLGWFQSEQYKARSNDPSWPHGPAGFYKGRRTHNESVQETRDRICDYLCFDLYPTNEACYREEMSRQNDSFMAALGDYPSTPMVAARSAATAFHDGATVAHNPGSACAPNSNTSKNLSGLADISIEEIQWLKVRRAQQEQEK